VNRVNFLNQAVLFDNFQRTERLLDGLALALPALALAQRLQAFEDRRFSLGYTLT
jgi:hypothetical protein